MPFYAHHLEIVPFTCNPVLVVLSVCLSSGVSESTSYRFVQRSIGSTVPCVISRSGQDEGKEKNLFRNIIGGKDRGGREGDRRPKSRSRKPLALLHFFFSVFFYISSSIFFSLSAINFSEHTRFSACVTSVSSTLFRYFLYTSTLKSLTIENYSKRFIFIIQSCLSHPNPLLPHFPPPTFLMQY